MLKKLIFLAVGIVLLVFGFKYFPGCNCQPVKAGPTLSFGSSTMSVLIADTPASRQQGLSGKDSLPPNTGMLFIFDTPGTYGFWMKEMKFDLDLVWINDKMVVIGISKGVKASSYPAVFYPPQPVKYVLEVPAGFADGQGLKVGQSLSMGQ